MLYYIIGTHTQLFRSGETLGQRLPTLKVYAIRMAFENYKKNPHTS